MSNNSHGCNKCGPKPTCTCKRPKDTCYSGGCPEKIDSACVIYNPKGGKSYLGCFLGLPSKSSAEKIFETLDEKLCNLFTLQVSKCVQTMLGVKEYVDYKTTLVKLLDYICSLEDTKVKVSASDKSNGYLADKIETEECLKKKIVTDDKGNQTLSISIDYACLATKIPTCLEVNCCGNTQTFAITAPVFSVCGSNVVTLQASNCLGTTTWFKDGVQVGSGTSYTGGAGVYYAICEGAHSNTITIASTGACPSFTASKTATFYKVCDPNCTSVPVSFTKTYSGATQVAANALRDGDTNFNADGQAYAALAGSCINCGVCVPVWVTATPLNILCGQALNTLLGTSDRNTCKKYILQSNQCNSIQQWIEYTGSDSDGSACPGCVPNSHSVTNTKTFTRNNCAVGCTPGTHVFSRTYTSLVSLAAAQTLMSNDSAQFDIDGQAAANNPANAICNCPSCIPTGALTCASNATSISYTDSCGSVIGTTSLNDLSSSCASTSGQGIISASHTDTNGFNPSDYIIEYAITSINGVAVSSPVYQANNQFTGLAHNSSYTVTMRTLRAGQTCSLSKSVSIGDCTSCNDPLGTISISSNVSSVCGSGSVTLNSLSANCSIIEWYRVNPLTPDLLVGTGASITLNPTQTSVYEARCYNCNLGHIASNTVTIGYLDICPGTCALDITSAGNLPNTERTVYFTGATPFTDYSYSTDGGNSWNPLTTGQLVVNTPGTYTYCVRKNSDTSCSDCVSFTVDGSSCIAPSNLSLTKVSQDANGIVISVNATNGSVFRYCNNSTFTCSNTCSPGDGSIGDSFVFPTSIGNSDTITVRVYNNSDPDCGCYTDITQTFTNTLCTPQWNNAVPTDIRCGIDPEVQQDACKQYIKQTNQCNSDVDWVYYSDNTGCGGCGCNTTSWTNLGIYRCENGVSEQQQGSDQCVGVTQWVSGGNACTNNVAGTASSTVDYYKSCPSGCTANAVPYTANSTVSVGSVSSSSVGQANADAQTQANNNVAADQAANGQNNANNTSDSIACNCPTCTPVWTNTTDIVCGTSIPSGETVVGGSVATCWLYVKQTNQCNGDVQWVQHQENICGCTPCLYNAVYTDIAGTEYCDGVDCRIQTQDQCGNQSNRLVQSNCSACQCVPVWTDNGNITCGQNLGAGYDPCKVYKEQTNQCNGITQWVFSYDEPTCGGCVSCQDPGVSFGTYINGYTMVVNNAGGFNIRIQSNLNTFYTIWKDSDPLTTVSFSTDAMAGTSMFSYAFNGTSLAVVEGDTYTVSYYHTDPSCAQTGSFVLGPTF